MRRQRLTSEFHRAGQTGLIKPAIIVSLCVGIFAAGVYLSLAGPDTIEPTEESARQAAGARVETFEVDTSGIIGGQPIAISGQLQINNSLVLTPSSQPTQMTEGQVYFDQATKQLRYYDGTAFQGVASTNDVAAAGQQPAPQSVTNVTQQTINNPTVIVDAPADVAQTQAANTFTQNNIFMQDVSVNGFTALQSTSIASLILGQPLGVASGGTGASSLASGGVIIGGGTGALSSVTASASGLCLVSTNGAPTFQACPGSGLSNAVTSTANTAGRIAKFGAGNTLVDSLLSESGATVSVAGNLNLGSYNLQLGNNGFGSTLNTTSLTANRSILLPDASGIVCLQGSSSCGFVTGTPADFIQNQNSTAQAGTNYWVAGVGRADGGLIGPSFDTATNGVLTIGGTASQVAVNSDMTVNGQATIAMNSTSVNSPLLQLQQGGSGDSTIELKNSTGSSFYVGMDQSAGGVFRIGSSTAARGTAAVGSLSAGGSQFQGIESQIIARKVATGPTDSGSLSSIMVHLASIDGAAGGVKVALYSHDAVNDRPGTLLGSTSTAAAGRVGWNAVPVSAPVASNTTYWVAVNIEGSGTGLSYNYCGCAVDSTTTYPRAFGAAWPVTHGAPNNALKDYEWSMYMNVAAGEVNDTYTGAKLFSMTASGAIILQNSIDTSSALQVQNAAGYNIASLNTSGGSFELGNSGLLDGKLVVRNAANNFTVTVTGTGATANRTISLGNESGTICIQGSSTCGFAGSSGSGSYIQNQNGAQQASTNFWISGTGRADTVLQAPVFDAAAAGALTLGGTNATSIAITQDTTLAAGKSLVITGGVAGTRPAAPTEGMLYYDTTQKRLLTYANGKWQADRIQAVLVAASNSSQVDKDAADYVADGNTAAAADGDQVQINQALTYASGRKVVLLAGTYVADATILVPNNTTLAGVGNGSVVELADLDVTENLIENSDTSTGTGVVIRDILLNGRKDLNTAGTQNGIYFSGMGAGLDASARSGGKVSDVTVTNFRSDGMYLNASSNNIISNSTVAKSDAHGFYLGNGSNNNSVTGSIAQGNGSYGFAMNTASYNTITGNITQGNNIGIYITSNSIGNVVSGNTIEGSRLFGAIISTSSTSNTFSGNTVRGSAFRGLSLSGASTNTISTNSFVDNGGSTSNNAIYIDTTANANSIVGNSITDNSATTTNYAIDISSSTSNNNYLADNVFNSGTIQDLGTGTVYANQARSANGGQQTVRTANDTNAFQIQSALGTGFFNADSTNMRISIGSVGGFSDVPTKLPNPATTPTGVGYGTAFSPDNQYMSVAHATTPFVTIYKRSGDTFTKLADPAILPTGTGTGAVFSPDGQYLTITHVNAPFITIYKRSGDTFTKLANPATLPTSTSLGAAFSADGQYMSVAHATTPFVTIYKRSGDTFTKLADPATLPTGTGRAVAFSPDNQYMSVAHATTPFITIYKRSGDTFTKLADPAILPTSQSLGVVFSPDGQYMSTSNEAAPFITIYKRTGDTFTKLANPAALPAGVGNGIAFSPDGQYLSIAHNTAPFITIYKRSGDTFTKLADPAILPGGIGYSTAFSPDGQYMSVGSATVAPYLTIYKGAGGATSRLELASGVTADEGLAFGKELKLYRSAPGILSLASGGSLSLEGGNLSVQGGAYFAGGVGVGAPASGNLLSIGTLTTPDASAQLAVSTGGAGNKGIVIQGVLSQTGDLLQVQDSSGTVLTRIDASGNLTVKDATVTGTLTVAGHIISGGSNPTIAAGAAACTTPTVNVSGTDTAGVITVTTGTGCAAAGNAATVTFATAFGAAPKVTLTPGSAAAAGLNAYLDDASLATTSFTLGFGTTPAASTTYKWHYHALQ